MPPRRLSTSDAYSIWTPNPAVKGAYLKIGSGLKMRDGTLKLDLTLYVRRETVKYEHDQIQEALSRERAGFDDLLK